MNCIIKSWRCNICNQEEFFLQPKKRHFSQGKLCKGEWECYGWTRKLKPLKLDNVWEEK